MNTLTTSPSENLSEGNIEILHKTSREWLNELSFMKEEIAFLESLLTRNTGHHFPTIESTELNKELTSLNSDVLTVLKRKVMEHEMWLSDAIRTDTLSRLKFYRELHGELASDIKDCHSRFTDLKKRIYSFVSSNMT